jgi:ankyrin repeat protein
MIRAAVVFVCILLASLPQGSHEKRPSYPSYDYEIACKHEIKPHRRTIPLKGVEAGFNQLHLRLIVSPLGDVVDASAGGDNKILSLWSQLEDEVREWKFTPFEENGKAVTAEVEEYIDLVPPERWPKKHVAPPVLRPNSKVAITLERTGCFGSCPSYRVTVSTEGTTFEGGGFVVAAGKHTDTVNADDVRNFARKFIAADFYSMDPSYRAAVTDNPTYVLAVAIDGHTKEVEDYVGAWEGMPEIIAELEDEVDAFARTERWIQGGDGLVPALRAEKFKFHAFGAQVMLKEAASHGESATVQALLDAGVPLDPLTPPKPKEPYERVPFENVGWLTAASSNAETLQILIDALASKKDQNDKDLALVGAARSGNVRSVRALIEYGANPDVDLSMLTVTESGGGMTMSGPGEGSVLIYAAESGNPEMIREILRYHPKLDQRDRDGKTAVFAAGDYRYEVAESKRAECVRLLVEAGADVNARDNKGNTPLHETFLGEVEKELLRLGADVNARNKDGETPIFTTYDDDAIPLFIEHGADLSIRNNKGETVMEAAKGKGPNRQEALRKAIEKLNER